MYIYIYIYIYKHICTCIKVFLKMGKWEAPVEPSSSFGVPQAAAFQFGTFSNFINSNDDSTLIPAPWGGAESLELTQVYTYVCVFVYICIYIDINVCIHVYI
jgi:hypothetical protein